MSAYKYAKMKLTQVGIRPILDRTLLPQRSYSAEYGKHQ